MFSLLLTLLETTKLQGVFSDAMVRGLITTNCLSPLTLLFSLVSGHQGCTQLNLRATLWESQMMQKPFYLLSWAMIFLQALLWGLFWSLVSIFFSNKNVSFLKSSTGELLHVLVSKTMPYSQVNVDQIRFLVFFLKIAKIWQNCRNHFHVAVFQMAVKWVRFFCFSNDVKQEYQ